MAEVVIPVPEELKEELRQISGREWSLFVNRLVRREFSRFLELKTVVSKSKLTESDVKELSEKVDRALAKRFRQSLKK